MKSSLFSMRDILFAGGLAVTTAGPALAHDVWLTLAGDAAHRRALVNYGHPDDRPPAFADKVVDLVAITANGSVSLLKGIEQVDRNGVPVAQTKPFVDDGHALLAARYDNGFWIKTADGLYRNATRRLAPDAADSMWSVKFAKAVTGPDAPWQKELGQLLEIVPLSDPGKVKPGETLRLKVLFQGKPLAGAEVERGDGSTVVAEKDIPRFKTDADGIASVPLSKAGPYLLVIDHKVTPSATPDQANADLFNATLWFLVGGKRDRR
jgi:nickel transport protein